MGAFFPNDNISFGLKAENDAIMARTKSPVSIILFISPRFLDVNNICQRHLGNGGYALKIDSDLF
tara:strand:- start:232212 stop:232406 length:195 start_codon:yes stop_codon:yes gene_type:complete